MNTKRLYKCYSKTVFLQLQLNIKDYNNLHYIQINNLCIIIFILFNVNTIYYFFHQSASSYNIIIPMIWLNFAKR